VQEGFAKTIRHNDAHSGNVLISPLEDVCILDWARVSSGCIGEDLCQLFQPWIYVETQFSTMEEVEHVERGLLNAYVRGVKDVLPSCDEDQIRFNYGIRSIVHSINRLNGRNKSMEKFLARAQDDRASMARLGLYYAFTSRKIAACKAMM
jgi:hypothetical protein